MQEKIIVCFTIFLLNKLVYLYVQISQVPLRHGEERSHL
jgi:hypothetical protein